MIPTQLRTMPSSFLGAQQAGTISVGTTSAAQFDISTIMNLLIPMIMMVMMMKVMTSAFEEKPKLAPVGAS